MRALSDFPNAATSSTPPPWVSPPLQLGTPGPSFYVIYSASGHAPKKPFSTNFEATKEAERLATEHPGIGFFVCRTTSLAKASVSVTTTYF